MNRFRARAIGCLLIFFCQLAAAQSGVTRMIVAFPPGGSSDLLARILAESLSIELKTKVIVDNRPGGNGALAANILLNAAPDGRTLWMTTAGAISINPELYPQLSYDPSHLVPVSLVANTDEVFVVNSKSSFADAREFVKKADPAKPPAIASSGIGSMPHMGVALFTDATGIAFTHIAEKGAAPAINDLMGGHVDGFFGDVSAVLPFIRSGSLKALGIAAKGRNPLFPDLMTFDEMGMKGIYLNNWSGVFVRAGTSVAVVDELNAGIRRALGGVDLRKKLAELGIQPQASGSAAFAEQIRTERGQWKLIIQKYRIQPE